MKNGGGKGLGATEMNKEAKREDLKFKHECSNFTSTRIQGRRKEEARDTRAGGHWYEKGREYGLGSSHHRWLISQHNEEGKAEANTLVERTFQSRRTGSKKTQLITNLGKSRKRYA